MSWVASDFYYYLLTVYSNRSGNQLYKSVIGNVKYYSISEGILWIKLRQWIPLYYEECNISSPYKREIGRGTGAFPWSPKFSCWPRLGIWVKRRNERWASIIFAPCSYLSHNFHSVPRLFLYGPEQIHIKQPENGSFDDHPRLLTKQRVSI